MAKDKQYKTEDGTVFDSLDGAVNYALKRGFAPPVEVKDTKLKSKNSSNGKAKNNV